MANCEHANLSGIWEQHSVYSVKMGDQMGAWATAIPSVVRDQVLFVSLHAGGLCLRYSMYVSDAFKLFMRWTAVGVEGCAVSHRYFRQHLQSSKCLFYIHSRI